MFRPPLFLSVLLAAPSALGQAAPSLAARLAGADPARGEAAAHRLCSACHGFEKGGPARVGPNLYGIVGAPRAGAAFAYSRALRAKGGNWGFAELDDWLADPRGAIPGTRMGFAGIADPGIRAEIVVFLDRGDHPLPLPPAGNPP